MVLESRHLVGLFFLWIVISGVVFTLGYLLGRNQNGHELAAVQAPSPQAAARPDGGVSAEIRPDASKPPAKSSGALSSNWDFFSSTAPGKASGAAKIGAKTETPAHAETKAAKNPPAAPQVSPARGKLLDAPLMPKNAIRLQVAALVNEHDALALAEALQQKKFPAFVLTPQSDQYYRVQVGPYADLQSAKIAQKGLEREGFKAIVKR